VDDLDVVFGDQLARQAALGEFGPAMHQETRREARQAGGKQPAEPPEQIVPQRIFHEHDAPVVRIELHQLGTCPGMHEKPDIGMTPAQDAEIMERQGRLAAECQRGVFGKDQHARRRPECRPLRVSANRTQIEHKGRSFG
jgi:hypothetical protein